MFKIFTISGDSLFPFYKDGNKVLTRKIFNKTKITIGDFVVFYKAEHGLMIKQVNSIVDGRYFVQGTDAYSIDSRNFGLIDFASLRYKVVCCG